MSHAILQMKAPRAMASGLVMTILVAFFAGVCAILAAMLLFSEDRAPGAGQVGGEQGSKTTPARAPRDPAAPGRRF